jgi:hypothetical protein
VENDLAEAKALDGKKTLLFRCCFDGETQIWLGDLRVVCRFVVLFCFSCLFY